MDLKYWIKFYQKLRKEGDFLIADELREMLRRMGYEIRNSNDDIMVVDVETGKKMTIQSIDFKGL